MKDGGESALCVFGNGSEDREELFVFAAKGGEFGFGDDFSPKRKLRCSFHQIWISLIPFSFILCLPPMIS